MSSAGSYEDRFDAAKYADDAPVGVFESPDDADALWLSDSLFYRLVAVAAGYNLHVLPMIRPPQGRGDPDDVRLNHQQLIILREELNFLGSLLAVDPLITELIRELDTYLIRRLGRPNTIVIFEYP